MEINVHQRNLLQLIFRLTEVVVVNNMESPLNYILPCTCEMCEDRFKKTGVIVKRL